MKRRTPFRLSNVIILAIGSLFLLAACSDSSPAATPAPPPVAATVAPIPSTPIPQPTAIPPTPIPEPTAAPISGSGIEGGDPDSEYGAMVSQGYWLSRDQFGPFVMASGMGIPFQPPMEMVQMAMQMVAQNPDDPAMVPENMIPLQAIYAHGSPRLINDPRDYDALDFERLRLDPSTFGERVRVRGQAETMLKEGQWAHSFGSVHFGEPTGDFGAQQRFMGMMISMLAQMQGQYAMKNLMGEDGLYYDSDGNLDYVGNWVMLHALADVAGLTGPEGGRYMNPDAHPMFEAAAGELFLALRSRQPESAREAAAAIRALAYLASTTCEDATRDAALSTARAIADTQLLGFSSADAVETAAAIAGLIAMAAADDDVTYRDATDGLFETLSADFDATHGVFNSKSAYGVDDVAWIVGGLNFLAQKGGDTNRQAAKDMLLAFYESTISLGGLQLSAPPGKNGAMAGEWEKGLPSVLYYHPANTPPPPMAQALPVPAEEITWDGSEWSISSDRFVPAGAMHLANELNWLGPHLGSIPFPTVPR